ncbi:acyl-CoA dehydrogenase [Caenispirillum bisanense]|uniref:3-methylmercaptopropionyl-CoA dehydrogenase n=1 Tax=Caenispirillum bisanense TaxID=414052 RepID=A0A286GB26_9PROT|nr:acyl-CoA dehydrogenase [Caenispirillum bisanense]SOD92692.1 Acyl-CoA dehydrogenase [Caenispirillum bisanense]
MSEYVAPLKDMSFALKLAGMEQVAALPGFEEASEDLVAAVLEEAGKFAHGVLSPINWEGDRSGGAKLENGVVRTAPGWQDAYRQFAEGGWNGVPFDPEYGGQGLPWVVTTAVNEMWQAANMSFGLCPLLNQGACELLSHYGSEEQKRTYLEKMVSGQWTGTMNLTEPGAGSDLSQVRTKAVKDGDVYKITGSKIFITYGDHDLTENIVHLVLARTPDAPEGVKGISLFIVPKVLVGADGSLGERNDARCVSLEHKLGIHASPTAVMAFGDTGGATGYLVGEENRGIEYMFMMMNNARLNVGLQGVAISERAYQKALAYAKERVQGKPVGFKGDKTPAIIGHPDMRRMLITMKALTEATRALAYTAMAQFDIANRHAEPEVRRAAADRVALLTPVVKAWSTDVGVEVASLGVQVHGGLGFVEETGAAQYYRDARIAPIYEGTNGIQANDLVFRKVARDKGAVAFGLIAEMRDVAAAATGDLAPLGAALMAGIDSLETATTAIAGADPVTVAAVAYPYLRLFGTVAGGWMMVKSAIASQAALAAGEGDPEFHKAKLATATFYATNLLPAHGGHLAAVQAGAAPVMTMTDDQYGIDL